MEKIPADSGPWMIGVSLTCQLCPRSAEWNTRATLPPVANQMLGSRSAPSGAKAPFDSRGLTARLEVVPFPFVLMDRFGAGAFFEFVPPGGFDADTFFEFVLAGELRGTEAPIFHVAIDGSIAMQELLAANAPSPSRAGGS